MPKRWATQLTLLAAWLGVAFLLGLWFGHVAWALAVGTLLYTARTLRRLYQLDQSLVTGKHVQTMATEGLWAELHARVYKLQTKSRARKRRYLRLLREVRESTGAIDEAGVILNADYEIMWFNPAARKLLGFTGHSDIGNRIDNLLRNPEFVEYLKGDRGDSIVVPSPVEKDGGMLSIQVVPYGKEQFLAIARDVTHEVRLSRARSDFVANASHELRSPLTVIGGYLDALGDDPDVPQAWRAPIAEMLRQVQRMTQILRDLIELTRLESTDEEAGRDFVSPRELLKRLVEELAVKDGPELKLELRADVGLLGSETELHSIFYNVIHNAMRFTPPTGNVTVSWDCDEDGAVFAVRDTGIGIAEELIPRLTERFYRVDPGRSRATGGTGLGLAIVKHALQRHGGRLEVESREGVGSTFSCHFPSGRVVAREGKAAAVV